MKRRLTHPLSRAILLAALLVTLSVAWAKQGNVFDQLDLLVDVRHELVEGYVEEPDEQAMIEAAVRGMVQSLDDPYTVYLTPNELEPFNQYVRGSFMGIGAEIDLYEDRPRIVTPLEDSPAWNAGLLAGDVILEIDGESTLDLSLMDAVKKITGEKGTEVKLRVRHESGEEETLIITRDLIEIHSVRGFLRQDDHEFDYMLDDAHRIGYLRITQFSERTAQEVHEALEQIKQAGARGLILDLRFNPGGLLEAAVQVSDMFLTQGQTIVSVKGRVMPEQVFRSTSDTIFPEIPIVVLANEASASAAEIVTGALADNDRALFVGTRTFGKGSVQQVRMLQSGQGALKLTTAYYYIPSGRMIHRRPESQVWGVDPSESSWVPMKPEAVREMLEARRQADTVRREQKASGEPITAAWIESHLKDSQLAAALRAILGKLETGKWPRVGRSNEAQLIREGKRASLLLRRDLLTERLTEIERELSELDADEPSEPPMLQDRSPEQLSEPAGRP